MIGKTSKEKIEPINLAKELDEVARNLSNGHLHINYVFPPSPCRI